MFQHRAFDVADPGEFEALFDRLRLPPCGCGQTMHIVAFITEPQVIDRILDHFRRTAQPRIAGSGLFEVPGGSGGANDRPAGCHTAEQLCKFSL